MKAIRALALMEKYRKCPKCGSSKYVNGEGNITIKDKTFKRTCKCGWKIEVEE